MKKLRMDHVRSGGEGVKMFSSYFHCELRVKRGERGFSFLVSEKWRTYDDDVKMKSRASLSLKERTRNSSHLAEWFWQFSASATLPPLLSFFSEIVKYFFVCFRVSLNISLRFSQFSSPHSMNRGEVFWCSCTEHFSSFSSEKHQAEREVFS